MNKGDIFGALFNNPSKAFDCLPHDLLVISKLSAYGFDYNATKFDYLTNSKQRTKISQQYRSWEKISTGFLQGSTLVSFLLIIDL